jgi:hypothetical protein
MPAKSSASEWIALVIRASASFSKSLISSLLTSFLLKIFTAQGYLKTRIYAMGSAKNERKCKRLRDSQFPATSIS